MRKKVDQRIRTLVENGVKLNERSMFVVVGDRGREQVVNLHYMLSKATVRSRPNVLWCYKKELYLSSHKKKRVKQIKKMVARGLMDAENEDPFSLFVASTDIKYTYYADTQKILGNTYGMAVLQDFEALTPNLLARTVETVEGGGIIVLLLSNMESLSQLYTMTMDVHSRFRTESHQHVVGRFNERFILSLGFCPTCIIMDDELNVLPISSHVQNIQPVGNDTEAGAEPEDLKELKQSLEGTDPAGALVSCCKTLDQGKAVVTFLDAASEKTLRSTVALTAARGRGKSAAMGIAVAGAVAMGLRKHLRHVAVAGEPQDVLPVHPEGIRRDGIQGTPRLRHRGVVEPGVRQGDRADQRPQGAQADDSVHPAAARGTGIVRGALGHRRGCRDPPAHGAGFTRPLPRVPVLHRQRVRGDRPGAVAEAHLQPAEGGGGGGESR